MHQNSSEAIASNSPRLPQRVRHALRFRRLQVTAIEKLSLHFRRITFAGAELEGFVSPGFDDHVKLIFPQSGTGDIRIPEVGPDGPLWPQGDKPVMRDYTPRRYDPVAGTLVIDFVLHESGPATTWAAQAKPGDWLGIGGPRGSFLIPTDFDWHLLVGDETAIPAISRRLEELLPNTRAIVLLEVDGSAEEVGLPSSAALDLQWCHRNGALPGVSTALLDALEQLVLPAGDGYGWVACETSIAHTLRKHLVKVRAMNPKWVKAAGYWRRGSAGSHETIEG